MAKERRYGHQLHGAGGTSRLSLWRTVHDYFALPRTVLRFPRLLWLIRQWERIVFYRKNVYAWEQIVRFVVGAAMIGGGFYYLAGWTAWLVAALALYMLLTGIFGYCPACAMIGRRPIDSHS
jgi:DUF2892 family protein